MAASRIPKGEDPDFLARAKLPHDPSSFSNLVREAFQIHHDCLQDGDIADTLGVTKGRISQILGKPELLKPDTIASILEKIPSKEARRRILFAWNRECFGLDLEGKRRGGTSQKKFTSASLKRVDRLIREERLLQAADLIQIGVELVKDYATRQIVLDRAFWLFHKLNRPGSAMQIAQTIQDEAEERREFARVAMAKIIRVRVLSQLPDVQPRLVIEVIEWLEVARDSLPEAVDSPHAIATKAFATRVIIATRLTLAEREIHPVSEQELAQFDAVLRRELSTAKTYQKRFSILLQLSRIETLRGDAFAAEELLIKAFRSGDVKNLQSLEMCGLVEARIMVRSGNLAKAIRHLKALSQNCFEAEDFYHGWLVETELARLLSRS